jgi:hypothetical protein
VFLLIGYGMMLSGQSDSFAMTLESLPLWGKIAFVVCCVVEALWFIGFCFFRGNAL